MKNNYGSVFRSLILVHQPKLVVELGTLDGYSAFHIAHALRFNNNKWEAITGKLYSYDLWDDYQYKHGNFNEVNNMIKKQGLDEYIELRKGNAYEVYKDFEDNSIDFLHIDISNNGKTLVDMLPLWRDKLKSNGIVAFEGGSVERDNVEWMKKYKNPSISEELLNNKMIYEDWMYQVLNPFPSLTLLWKR